MKALVVYDSVFGNTEKIAQEIAKALDTKAVKPDAVSPDELTSLKLLVIGSPTRAFSATPAIKAWIKSLKAGSLKGIHVASFDTRMNVDEIPNRMLKFMAKRFGYADDTIKKAISRKGGTPAGSDGFFVTGSEGPLKEGELERAAQWAKELI